MGRQEDINWTKIGNKEVAYGDVVEGVCKEGMLMRITMEVEVMRTAVVMYFVTLSKSLSTQNA